MPAERQPDINPYAPSAIPQPLDPPAGRGIGVWRDGGDIVFHPQAQLPRICVLTGRPARYGYFLKIAWSRPLDLMGRTLGLYVPLSAEVHHLCRRRRRLAVGSFLAACAVAALAIYRSDLAGAGGVALSLAVLLAVGLAAFYFYVQYSQFLYFGSLEGEYLRLKGADRRFLDRLPEWRTET